MVWAGHVLVWTWAGHGYDGHGLVWEWGLLGMSCGCDVHGLAMAPAGLGMVWGGYGLGWPCAGSGWAWAGLRMGRVWSG
jgi:hypothetical protein